MFAYHGLRRVLGRSSGQARDASLRLTGFPASFSAAPTIGNSPTLFSASLPSARGASDINPCISSLSESNEIPGWSTHVHLSGIRSFASVPIGSKAETESPFQRTFLGQLRRPNEEKIGYSVVGQIQQEEVPLAISKKNTFAVVQVGSHQFKVTAGDVIFAEKLLFADVNQKVSLGNVLLLGSKNRTMIGRPTLPDASVLALVEEQVLDAKVIVFKKKRRKNYRRTRGHRQELTRLRILDIVGIVED